MKMVRCVFFSSSAAIVLTVWKQWYFPIFLQHMVFVAEHATENSEVENQELKFFSPPPTPASPVLICFLDRDQHLYQPCKTGYFAFQENIHLVIWMFSIFYRKSTHWSVSYIICTEIQYILSSSTCFIIFLKEKRSDDTLSPHFSSKLFLQFK